MKILHGFFMPCPLDFMLETVTQAWRSCQVLQTKAVGMAITAHQDDLELSLLRTFLAVVRFGSMGRAAIAVCRTQPEILKTHSGRRKPALLSCLFFAQM